MNSRIDRCISCDSDKITKKKGFFSANVRGETVKIPGIEYYVCSRCGETFLDLDNESKIDRYLKERRPRTAASRS
jgi:YgiT-type zinc finger domain-containing protein